MHQGDAGERVQSVVGEGLFGREIVRSQLQRFGEDPLDGRADVLLQRTGRGSPGLPARDGRTGARQQHLLAQLAGGLRQRFNRVEPALPQHFAPRVRGQRRSALDAPSVREPPPPVEEPEGQVRPPVVPGEFVEYEDSAGPQQCSGMTHRLHDVLGGVQDVVGDDDVVVARGKSLCAGLPLHVEGREGHVRHVVGEPPLRVDQERLRNVGIAVLGEVAALQLGENALAGAAGARPDLQQPDPVAAGVRLRAHRAGRHVVEVVGRRVPPVRRFDQLERAAREHDRRGLRPPGQDRGQGLDHALGQTGLGRQLRIVGTDVLPRTPGAPRLFEARRTLPGRHELALTYEFSVAQQHGHRVVEPLGEGRCGPLPDQVATDGRVEESRRHELCEHERAREAVHLFCGGHATGQERLDTLGPGRGHEQRCRVERAGGPGADMASGGAVARDSGTASAAGQ
ncbi:hypothetical protein SMICM304S_02130 [Streptomyces microflavus]